MTVAWSREIQAEATGPRVCPCHVPQMQFALLHAMQNGKRGGSMDRQWTVDASFPRQLWMPKVNPALITSSVRDASHATQRLCLSVVWACGNGGRNVSNISRFLPQFCFGSLPVSDVGFAGISSVSSGHESFL